MTITSILTYILALFLIAFTLFNLYATMTAKKRKQISSASFKVICNEIEKELIKLQKEKGLNFSYVKRMANDQNNVIIFVKDLDKKFAAIAMKDDIKLFSFSDIKDVKTQYEKSNKKILSAKVDVTINDETWTYTFASKPFNPKGIIGKVIYETTEEFAQELKAIKG